MTSSLLSWHDLKVSLFNIGNDHATSTEGTLTDDNDEDDGNDNCKNKLQPALLPPHLMVKLYLNWVALSTKPSVKRTKRGEVDGILLYLYRTEFYEEVTK